METIADIPVEQVQAKSSPFGDFEPSCRWGSGIALGAYRGEYRWEDLGGSPWNMTASVVLAASCELTTGKIRPWFGIESAPYMVTFDFSNTVRHQVVSSSVGMMFGPDIFQVGIHATGGLFVVSGGIRAVVNFPHQPGRTQHHLELRVASSGPVPWVQGMVLYSTTIGRRR